MKKVVSCLLSVVLLLALAVATPKPVQAIVMPGYSMENAPALYMCRESSLSHVTLGWTGRNDADGYQVYVKTEYDKKYHKLATVKGLTYTTKSLEGFTSYSFKVRAYAKKNGKTVYGPFSYASTVTISAVSYADYDCEPVSEKMLSEMATMIGGMKKVSSKTYTDFAMKGNGVSIGYGLSRGYPKPYFMIRVKGNQGFYFSGIRCGYTRENALGVSGSQFHSEDNGKTFIMGHGVYAGVKLVPTYDKNDVITELLYTETASS